MTSPGLGVGGEEGEAGEGGVAGHPELAPPQVHGEGPRGAQLHVHLAIRRVVGNNCLQCFKIIELK